MLGCRDGWVFHHARFEVRATATSARLRILTRFLGYKYQALGYVDNEVRVSSPVFTPTTDQHSS